MAEKYDLLTYDTEEERIIDPVGPPPKNLIAAAEFLDTILLNAGIPYAIMGGFALFLRASNRPTQDIDVVVDSSPRAIWNVIEIQERMIIPASRLIDGVIKVFVKTGPGYDACPSSYNVEIDLIIKGKLGVYLGGLSNVGAGAKGSPRNVESEREPLRFYDSDRKQYLVFQGLNIRYMMKTKLRAHSDRGLPRDITDIFFLLDKYPEKVKLIAEDLDEDEVNCFIEKVNDPQRKLQFIKLLVISD